MIISVSGQRVKNKAFKRPGKVVGSGQVLETPQSVRPWGRAKSRNAWAYRLTETGLDAIQQIEARPAGVQQTGETLSQIRERYSVVRDGNTLAFTGDCLGDYALLSVETGDADRPGPCCFHKGTQAHLPALAFELVAQVWLSSEAG